MAWAPDYVSVDDLSDYLRIPDIDDDVQLGLAAAAASRAVDQECARQFGQIAAAEPRIYTARYDHGRYRWVLDIDDLQDATGLAVDVDGTAVATFQLEPVNATADGIPWTRILFTPDSEAIPSSSPYRAEVTAKWGWTAVPTIVQQATMLQASRFFTRRNAPFGIAGSPDQGSEMRLLARVDPDVAVILRPVRRSRSPF